MTNNETCLVEYNGVRCDRPKRSKGLCNAHYQRLGKFGDVRADVPLTTRSRNTQAECKIKGCNRSPVSRQMCKSHWQRWSRTGIAGEAIPEKATSKEACLLEGCNEAVYCKSRCQRHYSYWSRTGRDHRQCETCDASLDGAAARVRFCSDECKPRCRATGCNKPYYFNDGYCINCHSISQRNEGVIPSLDFECSICGTLVERDGCQGERPKPRTICDECNPRGNWSNLRKRLNLNSFTERDGDGCALCGEYVDLNLSWPDRMSPSVDHIVPISLGGTSNESNLQLVHLGCNSRKGNRVKAVASAST